MAIVGAGPAGLTAAYFLLRRGHGAVLFDAHDAPGGMLRYGIPAFRLPHAVLDQEIDVIRLLGGEFRMGRRLGTDMTLEDLRRDFDAVFLAIGAQGSRGLECPGEELALPALAFLEGVSSGRPATIGDDVLVLGGGNTAMDASRTAVRLGARRVTVLYRRTRREMPCLMAEVEAAEAEGVTLETLVAPVGLERSASGTLLLTCTRMALGAADESGRARPVPIPGSTFTLEATTVIAAIGQTVDASGLRSSAVQISRRGILVDPATLATNVPGVFAGGDGVSGADLAVRAVAAGKLAAVSIDQYLGGRRVQGDPEMVNVVMGKLDEQELAAFFREVEESPRAAMAERPVAERVKDFERGRAGLRAGHGHAGGRALHALRLLEGHDVPAPPVRHRVRRRPAALRRRATLLRARLVAPRDRLRTRQVHPLRRVRRGGRRGRATGSAWRLSDEGSKRPSPCPLKGTLVEALPTVARRVADICPTGAFGLEGRWHLRAARRQPAGSPRRRPQRDCHSVAPGDMSATSQ